MPAIIPENKPNSYKARMFWGAAFFIGAALLFDALLGGPKIYIEQNTANIAGVVLASLFLLLLGWITASHFKRIAYLKLQNTRFVIPTKVADPDARRVEIQTNVEKTGFPLGAGMTKKASSAIRGTNFSGPNNLLRAPLPAAFIIFGFTAFAILLKSWLILLAIIPIYTIWTQIMETKEAWLAQKYGKDYLVYQKQTGLFLPRLRQLNKPAFYSASALIIFSAIFIGLNSSSVYLRWVTFEKNSNKSASQINTGQTLQQNSGQANTANQIFQAGGQPQNIGLIERIFGTNSTSAGTNPSSTQTGINTIQTFSTSAATANFISEPNTIIIQKLNLRAPIVAARGVSQKELNAALDKGVVLYPGSAQPGENGEVFLTGHSSVYPWNKTKYGQVFTLLDKLEAGDIVAIKHNNQTFNYKITDKQILKPDQLTLSSTREPRLTLMTCWPIGTALKRLVVRGVLVR